MDSQELNTLYNNLLQILRAHAPWVETQIEETIRQGRPVARRVSRRKGAVELVVLGVAPFKLRDDQFAATEELSPKERAMVGLQAMERLLVDPPAIDRAMRETMTQVGVNEVLFVEPSVEDVASGKPAPLTFTSRDKVAQLLDRVTREIDDGR